MEPLVTTTWNIPEHALRIAVAQPAVVPGDIERNLDDMRSMAAVAAAQGAVLILFSECGITGYDHQGVGIRHALRLDDPVLKQIDCCSAENGIAIVQGFYEQTDGGVFNTAVLCTGDGPPRIQRKHRIIDWELAHGGVLAGPRRRQLINFAGKRLAILICADNGIDDILPELAGQGCDLLLSPTAGCGELAHGISESDLHDPQGILRLGQLQRGLIDVEVIPAASLGIARVNCNQMGFVPELGYFQPGHSSIIDHAGDITALIPGQPVHQRLRPSLAVGFVTPRRSRGSAP